MNKVQETSKKGYFATPLLSGKALVLDHKLKNQTICETNNYEKNIWSFNVQEKYGKTLELHIMEALGDISIKTVAQTGM